MEVQQYESTGFGRQGEDEVHIEQLLSEKLMQGYVLLEKSCPVCATPLVKSHEEELNDDEMPVRPTMVPSRSFDQPFIPVDGVPFCVHCNSHVITQECEISILERCDSLKNKGSILVALQDNSYGDGVSQFTPMSGVDEKPEPEAAPSVDTTDAALTPDMPQQVVEEEEAAQQKTRAIDLPEEEAPAEVAPAEAAPAEDTPAEEPTHVAVQEEPATPTVEEEKQVVQEEQTPPTEQQTRGLEPAEESPDTAAAVVAEDPPQSVKATPSETDADEKKDDDQTFENQHADEIMTEYSVR